MPDKVGARPQRYLQFNVNQARRADDCLAELFRLSTARGCGERPMLCYSIVHKKSNRVLSGMWLAPPLLIIYPVGKIH